MFRSLRKINRDVFIILCSGYNHIICAGINKLLQSGAAGFFERPASSQDIGIAIKNAQHISATVDKQVCLIARRAGLSSSITMFSRPAALARYAVRPGISKILLFAAAYVFSKKTPGFPPRRPRRRSMRKIPPHLFPGETFNRPRLFQEI